ncbi:N-acetylmuramoyl-L-alanine amidase [Acanthopleuribacter pedis]|uniref:N-acetylmuramoyl-L-alanine amidase n=1 Tax=Acanthopleuribacter pedis TaxID=442870 RepID=A0A8J7Q9N5_9BACT|nr:N-acetylmuramoyl-L-alanine amidase [Acanthopleuribacter pedis]MBO1320277.1 N-acetylmuramoyl-L-alanine amidase [Acanthopleuribacter pedis]
MRQLFVSFALVWLFAIMPLLAWPHGAQVQAKVDQQSQAVFVAGKGAFLTVSVKYATELDAALRMYTGRLNAEQSLEGLGIVRTNDRQARLPFEVLSPLFQKSFLRALWPKDKMDGAYWHHHITHKGRETLWAVALLYTGSGQHYREIMRVNKMTSPEIEDGRVLKIPRNLLRPILQHEEQLPPTSVDSPREPMLNAVVEAGLKQAAKTVRQVTQAAQTAQAGQNAPPPTAAPAKPTAVTKARGTAFEEQLAEQLSYRRQLTYGRDKQGRYALYALKSGEAIYSAVVVRFCGLVSANDVNRVAKVIIERNQIRDETDLPVGRKIKIPYNLLEPEFRAADDAAYLAWQRNLEAVARIQTQLRVANLKGVHVILDAGHGGRDPGAHFGHAWEDDFVYDVLCRVKLRLETETKAKVYSTVTDPSIQFVPQDVKTFQMDHDEVLNTKPVYKLNSSTVTTDGVNLRWMIANYHYQRLVKSGVKPENIFFASFHADSLHRGLSGGMVYVPDARVYPRKVVPYRKFSKYREYAANRFSFSRKEMQQAQARSFSFAKNYVTRSRRLGVPVHDQKPIRSLIYRTPTKPFVPAVLKYNRIPTRALIEVCNLNNKTDRENIASPRFRQKLADTFVEALYMSYGVRFGDDESS